MSEIRKDRLRDTFVLIAPERLHRPDVTCKTQKHEKKNHKCPFCEGSESLTPKELFAIRQGEPNASGWKTRVVPNLYKAVQVELDGTSSREGFFESFTGVGAHEVIIDSPCHSCGMWDLGAEQIEHWLRTIIIRIDDLKKDHRLVHISVFKNSGASAGATQEHPHTQILALPLIPKNEQNFLDANANYYRRHGRGLVADVLTNELHEKRRVIAKNEYFAAFCPFASAFAFEVMVVPLKNSATLEWCSREEVSALANMMVEVFAKLHAQLGNFEYNLYFRLPPINANFQNETHMPNLGKNYRFYLHITPRIYNFGGFEIATNMAINPVAPEECALLLGLDAQR